MRMHYLNIVNVVAIPDSSKHRIAESQHEHVLHHLLAQVMINTKDLVLAPIRR